MIQVESGQAPTVLDSAFCYSFQNPRIGTGQDTLSGYVTGEKQEKDKAGQVSLDTYP
jgi:hypothetical protein